MRQRVFVSGGTGYIGRALIEGLFHRGHEIRALVRAGSEKKLPAQVTSISGNPLVASTFARAISPYDTFVHLVGTSHPNPWKKDEFRRVDLGSAVSSIEAAVMAGISHFIYLSVAHPAPVMKSYIAVRMECEEKIRSSGLGATILRPWYVLGPGHRWPYALFPLYYLSEKIAATREGARRLGLVTLREMVASLVWAVENPPDRKGGQTPVRILTVPDIRRLAGSATE
jgi:uncharacterized protein YbjT (DUF2867 family)